MNAVDTNVLLYSVDSHEPEKRAAAMQLLRRLRDAEEPTMLLWQVLCETTCQLRRWSAKGRIPQADADAYISAFRDIFPLETPHASVFDQSVDYFKRFRLSHWDSLLIAACTHAGITTLYSEDMDSGTDFDGLRVVNPFQ